jgi:hypothetical protein
MGEIVAERLLGTAFLAMFVSREAAVMQQVHGLRRKRRRRGRRKSGMVVVGGCVLAALGALTQQQVREGGHL